MKSIIKNLERHAISAAQKSANGGNRFRSSDFITKYFGGKLLDGPDGRRKPYELAVQTNEGLAVWLVDGGGTEDVRNAALEAKARFGTCDTITVVVWRVGTSEPERILLTGMRHNNATLDSADAPTPTSVTTDTTSREGEYIGKIIMRERLPLRLSLKKNQIYGYLKDEYAKELQPGNIVTLEPDDEHVQVFARVDEIRAYPKSGAAFVKKVEEFAIPVIMNPFLEADKEYIGPVRVDQFDGWNIRHPTPPECALINNMPEDGWPLGYAPLPKGELPFYFPNSPTDALYQSVVIAGVQGSGKTNLLRLIARVLASHGGVEL